MATTTQTQDMISRLESIHAELAAMTEEAQNTKHVDDDTWNVSQMARELEQASAKVYNTIYRAKELQRFGQ
jgi:hypothetical protein